MLARRVAGGASIPVVVEARAAGIPDSPRASRTRRPDSPVPRGYADGMRDHEVPEAIAELARARQQARIERDWPEADRLKAEIERAGWRVVDRGADSRLEPTEPPDVVVDGVVRHGSSGSVPSLLEGLPTAAATVVVVATGPVGAMALTLDGLSAHLPAGIQLVAVTVPGAGPPDPGTGGAPVDGAAAPEVVAMAGRVRPGTALNAGIRRATGEVVVIVAAGALPTGDVVTPLVAALADPTVAVVGGWGSRTSDLRRFDPAPAGEVDVLDPTCLAFRRADVLERGPLEERFLTWRGLATWWSLVLRDEGEGRAPRRALALADLPLDRPAAGEAGAPVEPTTPDRRAKRDAYRVLDRFGWRRDLVVQSADAPNVSAGLSLTV